MDKSTPSVRCLNEFAILASLGIEVGDGKRYVLHNLIICLFGRITLDGLCSSSVESSGTLIIR